jgi:hypothetical protein
MPDPSKWSPAQAAYQRHLDQIEGLALRTAGGLYPSLKLAVVSLDWLEAQSLIVLGFDGFTTDGEWIIPSMEHIADFSDILDEPLDWAERVRRSIDASRRVLAQWFGKVQFVDMVVASRDEDFDRTLSP